MTTLPDKIVLAALLALTIKDISAEAEKQPANQMHNFVFEVSIEGGEKWEAALRNVENAQKALGTKTTTIEVVAHGRGIGMLLAKTSTAIVELTARLDQRHAAGAIFAACENTMKRERSDKKCLVGVSTIIDSGVSEVIRKQEVGYANIKSGGYPRCMLGAILKRPPPSHRLAKYMNNDLDSL